MKVITHAKQQKYINLSNGLLFVLTRPETLIEVKNPSKLETRFSNHPINAIMKVLRPSGPEEDFQNITIMVIVQ